MASHVRATVAQVLRIPDTRIDAQSPLRSLGLDSLMAIELRGLLENSLRLSLSATIAWTYPTISALAQFLADEMGVPLDAGDSEDDDVRSQTTAGDAGRDDDAPDLAQLSTEEMATLLKRQLSRTNGE